MRFDTRVVRGGISPDPTTGAIVPPIAQSATFVLEEVGRDKGFDYTRSSNPSRLVLENALCSIEGAKHCAAFSSGMSAVDAVLRTLDAGDHIVSSDDVYGGVSRLFNTILTRHGFEFSYVDTSYPERVAEAIRPNTKMVWMETPTNPLLKVTDVEEIVKICKAKGIPLAVDSTFATPALLRPLELGADIVMHSTTKYLSGHNQIIGGAVLTDDPEFHEKMRYQQKSIGAIPSPFDCYLTVMGLKTLSLRMTRHCSNGMAVACYLDAHPKVAKVIYPGLESHERHEVAARQMSGFGGMISFELTGGLEAGRTLMNSLKLCALAESLGAVETMITHPATMTHADVPRDDRIARVLSDSLVRLSVGIEDPEDIIEDLAQALEKA
ncbi:MAG TPA: PLP-dependent transferase [Myxococcales bacterium]|nr:PLP-dependent transferase [Myxococcales bacterium]